MASPRAAEAARQQARAQQGVKRSARRRRARGGLRIHTGNTPRGRQPEPAEPSREGADEAVGELRSSFEAEAPALAVCGTARQLERRPPPPSSARVLTPHSAMKARRVSWGSASSSASSEAGSERAAAADSDSVMEQLSLPEPCCSPRIGGSTHAPGIKGARWVREQRAERTRRHEAEAQTARSSAEEKELQKELGQVLRQSQEIIKELSPTEGAPLHMPLRSPPAQAWAADEPGGKRVAFADDAASCSSAESDGSSASGEASSGSACSSSSSSSASSGSGFTLRLRFKLPSHRGGGSARLRVAPGEDPLSAAQRFGRENSLRPHEVDKVRHGIQKQLSRIDRRLRVEPPPPKSGDAATTRSEVAQKPTSTVAEEAPNAQAAEVPVKSVRTWVAMTPEEIAEWRLLQRCKQKASAASSPSLPVSELADSFRVRWAEDSAATASGAGTGTGAGAAAAQPQLRIPHRASYSPDIRNPAADADSDSESDSDCSSSSSESEPEVVGALPSGLDSLRLSVEQQRAQQQRRDGGKAGDAEGGAAVAPGAPAVRGRSINTGVEGATPKEVKECSLVRTPTKQVKKMGRYKRRTARAQAEAALNEKLQRYTAELAAATHRRGRSRHVIDLPAHVVAHIRGKISECQQQLAEMQPDYNEGTRFRPWFLGDRCRLVRSPRAGAGAGEFIDAATFIKSERAAAVAGAVSGRVEYVGPAPSLGRGVWVGLVLGENEGHHDGTVGGRSYFSCEAGRGVLVRPKALLPIEEGSAAAAADRPRRSE